MLNTCSLASTFCHMIANLLLLNIEFKFQESKSNTWVKGGAKSEKRQSPTPFF